MKVFISAPKKMDKIEIQFVRVSARKKQKIIKIIKKRDENEER